MATDDWGTHEFEELRAALAPPRPYGISPKGREDLAFMAGTVFGKKVARKKMIYLAIPFVVFSSLLGFAVGFFGKYSPFFPEREILYTYSQPLNNDGTWTVATHPDCFALAMGKTESQELGSAQEWTIAFAFNNWDEIKEKCE